MLQKELAGLPSLARGVAKSATSLRLPNLGTRVTPLFNLTVSNVPGSRARLRFHGAEMEAFYPVSRIGQGLALNLSLIGHADQLAFGLVAFRDSVPSMQRLGAALGEAFDKLKAAFHSPTPDEPATPGRWKKARAPRSGESARAGKAAPRRTRAKPSTACVLFSRGVLISGSGGRPPD